MAKKLKVALVMGGGWSLGAFTGGAAWELVRQLHGNRDRDTYDRCEIDVLCGTGAGALTAAVVLRALSNPEGFSHAGAVARLGEALRAAWLEGVDFTRLLRRIDIQKASLLDRGAIDELAMEVLAWPVGSAASPVLLGERVLLSIKLLNFNGVPVRASNTADLPCGMSTTRFDDRRVFCFDFDGSAGEPAAEWRHFDGARIARTEAWREVAATAVASGAFPIAFEPVVLQRYREEFGDLWPEELNDRDDFPFTYGDAGPFNREPLREAMRLIPAQDAHETPGTFDRVVIFVDPSLSGSKHAFGLKFHLPYMIDGERALFDGRDVVPAGPAAHLVAITNRYGVLARHQSTYDDFIAAAKVNRRRAARGELREVVAKVAARLAQSSDASDLAAEIEAKIDHAATNGGDTGEPAERLARALMALVDDATEMTGRQEVRVIAIGPTEYHPPDGSAAVPVKLAGDFFVNFGGFFDARFRVHDLEAGRALAAAALAGAPRILADAADRPAYTPWTDPPPSLESVPAARDRFVRRIAELTRQLLEYKLGYLGVTQAISIVAHYVTPRLVRDSGPNRRPAILRIEVESPDDHEFFLMATANGDRGGDARRVGELVVLHTVVHFSDSEVIGPHVSPSPTGWIVRLTARGSHLRARPLEIPVPDPASLRANADCGLPIHRIRVHWPTRVTSVWAKEDALQEWPGAYDM